VWEFISSTWTLAVVPSAIAIAGVCAFAKTLLEKRNLQLENQRLQLEISAAERRIIVPSEGQIEKYGVVRVAINRTVRLSGILLAVLLPVSVALQTGPMSSVPPPDLPPPAPTPAPTPARPPDPVPAPSIDPPEVQPGINPQVKTPSQTTPAPAPPRDGSSPTPPAPTEIAMLLRQYEAAINARDIDALRRIYPSANASVVSALSKNPRELRITLQCEQPTETDSKTAIVTCLESLEIEADPRQTNIAVFRLVANSSGRWIILDITRKSR
jgi:hypothetical protein